MMSCEHHQWQRNFSIVMNHRAVAYEVTAESKSQPACERSGEANPHYT